MGREFIIRKPLTFSTPGTVRIVLFYPPTPQGGLFNSLFFNKSPLGDLGVDNKRGIFSTDQNLIFSPSPVGEVPIIIGRDESNKNQGVNRYYWK
jgi:hypothetical protein